VDIFHASQVEPVQTAGTKLMRKVALDPISALPSRELYQTWGAYSGRVAGRQPDHGLNKPRRDCQILPCRENSCRFAGDHWRKKKEAS